MSLRNRKMVPYRGTGITEQVILWYSSVPNRRVGQNKCAGGKIL